MPGCRRILAVLVVVNSSAVAAAEWTATPSLGINVRHNDNVSMRSSNELSSVGYSVTPALDLSGRDQNWGIKLRSVARSYRYQDIENADSDNYFFNLGGGYSTETQRFGMDTSFSRNNTYDTNYDTQLPDAQLLDDHTERETTSFAPYWQWQMSETGVLQLGISTQDVEYDEVTSQNYKDYQYDSAYMTGNWNVTQRSRLGFSIEFQNYNSAKTPFTYYGESYNEYIDFRNQRYQLEYSYMLSETTRFDLSMGKRRTTTTFHDQLTECLQAFGPFCVVYAVGDRAITDDGADLSLEFSHSNEVSSFDVSLSRMVQPASFGGAQELDTLVLKHGYSWTERVTSSVLLEASETTSIDGLDAVNDRERYRIEPRLSWRLTKDWRLDIIYRHISQTFTQTDADSQSNTYIIGLNMTWPKLF